MSKEFLKLAKQHFKNESITKEVDTETEFCEYAKSKGCEALKLILLNKRGFPDRTVLCPGGKIFFIEFKRATKGRLRTNQSKVRKMLDRLGFDYYICDNLKEAIQTLDKYV